MTDLLGVPPEVFEIEAKLTAPGGLFELEEAEVLGNRMLVFKNRTPTLRAHLERSVGFGDREYVAFTDGTTWRRFTFAQHERLVASTAAALRDIYDVKKGDRVAILGANSPEWIITFWATVSLGAIAVGLNGWWTGPEVRYGVDDCEPALLVADARRLARLEGADPGVPVVEMETGFESLVAYAPGAPLPDEAIDEDDPAVILYTSGTTGRPKGAINTHRNVNSMLQLNLFSGTRSAMLNPPPPDLPPNLALVTSPLFHVSALNAACCMYLGLGLSSIWLVGRFDPVVVMRLIESERITSWGFTGTVLHRVVHHPDAGKYDLSSLRTLGGGGSPISVALLERSKEVFPNVRGSMAVGYGLTESSALAATNSGMELELFPESVGRTPPTVSLEIRGPDGEVLADGEEGEIYVRGPIIMPGYWRRPEATAEAITPDGWLRTGDIGRVIEGRLYVSARRRDLILRGGENVYPVEIEHRLQEHPDVAEAAVVGVDHPELGQDIRAIVVARPGADLDVEDLRTFCAESLAYYKVPSHWEVRSEPLPRNATGKLLRNVLTGDAALDFVEE